MDYETASRARVSMTALGRASRAILSAMIQGRI